MALLRIGDTTINIDNVTTIEQRGGTTYVSLAAPESLDMSEIRPQMVALAGDEARALAGWLDANATNLTPKTEMDEEWEAYKAKGGTMDRARFEADVQELRRLNREMDEEPDLNKWDSRLKQTARLEERLMY